MISIVHRIKYRVMCIVTFIKYKLLYGRRYSVDPSVRIPNSCKIRISANGQLVIKKNVIMREYVVINVQDKGSVIINDGVFINDFVCINARKEIIIDSETIIGQGAKFYDHDHDYLGLNLREEFKTDPIYVGKMVWIGADALVLRGTQIGDNCVIGAGTFVKMKLSNNNIYYNYRAKNISESKSIRNRGVCSTKE